jgi:hypothetical protein
LRFIGKKDKLNCYCEEWGKKTSKVGREKKKYFLKIIKKKTDKKCC